MLEQYSVIMMVTKIQYNISSNTFVGSNVSLVAPLKIGESVTIGAGSTITDDISDKELSMEELGR